MWPRAVRILHHDLGLPSLEPDRRTWEAIPPSAIFRFTHNNILRYENETNPEEKPLTIGDNNIFEGRCEIYTKSIGNFNIFESDCFVGPDVDIGNGCNIGSGSRVTAMEKLEDYSIVVGSQVENKRLSMDTPADDEDEIRQIDELIVMVEIFPDEFQVRSGPKPHAVFEAQFPLPNSFRLSVVEASVERDMPLSYLPPISLLMDIPKNYPSQSPPTFSLLSRWLSKTKLNLVAAELIKLWEENKCEILYIWCDFLKNGLANLINIGSSYNLIEKFPIENLRNKMEKLNYSDSTTSSSNESNNKQICVEHSDEESNVTNDQLTAQAYEKLINYYKDAAIKLYLNLIQYNTSRCSQEFKKNLQDCIICFGRVKGEQCIRLTCDHITCAHCLKQMCEIHINQGTVDSIVCAQEGCEVDIPTEVIKGLISKELFEKLDKLLLNQTIEKISTGLYCPQVHCQYPIIAEPCDSLAICPSCKHAFCIFCKRTYHGIEACRLESEEKKEIIEMYQTGGYKKKLELEKKYGKKILNELVSTAQSQIWMSKNSKPCPCCNVYIEKNYGCNKMICFKCKTNFCWTCERRVSSLNPYLHFQDPNSPCYNTLFDGILEGDIEEVRANFEEDIPVEFEEDVPVEFEEDVPVEFEEEDEFEDEALFYV